MSEINKKERPSEKVCAELNAIVEDLKSIRRVLKPIAEKVVTNGKDDKSNRRRD